MSGRDPTRTAINRAYRFVDEQQRLFDDGEITEAQWYDNHNEYFTEAYLSTDDPRAQSGLGESVLRRECFRVGTALHGVDRGTAARAGSCRLGIFSERLLPQSPSAAD